LSSSVSTGSAGSSSGVSSGRSFSSSGRSVSSGVVGLFLVRASGQGQTQGHSQQSLVQSHCVFLVKYKKDTHNCVPLLMMTTAKLLSSYIYVKF
jgi:hypothetical protein